MSCRLTFDLIAPRSLARLSFIYPQHCAGVKAKHDDRTASPTRFAVARDAATF
jgi:hypothetical protein